MFTPVDVTVELKRVQVATPEPKFTPGVTLFSCHAPGPYSFVASNGYSEGDGIYSTEEPRLSLTSNSQFLCSGVPITVANSFYPNGFVEVMQNAKGFSFESVRRWGDPFPGERFHGFGTSMAIADDLTVAACYQYYDKFVTIAPSITQDNVGWADPVLSDVIPNGDDCGSVAISRDGSLVAVWDASGVDLHLYQRQADDSYALATTITLPEKVLGVAMTIDGSSVAISSNTASGAAALIYATTDFSAWSLKQTLAVGGGTQNAGTLGCGIAITPDANVVALGCIHDRSFASSGMVVVYQKGDGGEYVELCRLGVTGPNGEGSFTIGFGVSLAISDFGDVIAIGSPFSNQPDQPAAFNQGQLFIVENVRTLTGSVDVWGSLWDWGNDDKTELGLNVAMDACGNNVFAMSEGSAIPDLSPFIDWWTTDPDFIPATP